jgi:hypothetical protein
MSGRPRAAQHVIADLETALDHVKSLAGREGHDRCAVPDDVKKGARNYLESWAIPPLERALRHLRNDEDQQ